MLKYTISRTKPLTPSKYAKIIGVTENISDNISIERFDSIITKKYGLWNYPINKQKHLEINEIYNVSVQFKEGLRLVEVPKEYIKDIMEA